MANSNKVFIYLIGLILLVAGLGVALEIVDIPFYSVLLLLSGIFVWAMYLKLKVCALKYVTCFLVPIGLSYFFVAAFHLVGKANFIAVYSALVCSFLCVYLLNKNKIFMYISLIITMFVLHMVTNSTSHMQEFIYGYDCFYIGLLSTFLFVFEHKKYKYKPIYVAVIAYLGGVLNFLSTLKIITPNVFKLLISLMFVLSGGVIILYNYIRSKKHSKENCCE